ncbi:MAG: STM4015 family protein [Gemmataceae bacterium]
MTIAQHLTKFAGLPVQQYDFGAKKRARKPCVYRVALEYEADTTFPELLDHFLTEYGGKELTALVLGAWSRDDMLGDAAELVESLVANRGRMPNLRALFFGDITYDECEISWINPGDLSPLLPAFPKLEEFRIRGVGDLTFGRLKHGKLRSFAIESGGLPAPLLQEVFEAELPKLEHLELWLGSPGYGGISIAAPLEPLLSGKRFRKLKYLGLRNSEITDAVASAAAEAPILARLAELDLSLGTLGDDGAEAILKSSAIRKLKKLDLHHHFISAPFVKELKKLPLEVDISDAKEPNFYTYNDSTEVMRYNVASE